MDVVSDATVNENCVYPNYALDMVPRRYLSAQDVSTLVSDLVLFGNIRSEMRPRFGELDRF